MLSAHAFCLQTILVDTVETPENGPLGQRMGHLFPSKLACHTLPFWQHLQAAQAGGPYLTQITWATISLYFKDDPGLQMVQPWLSIFSEYKSTLKIFGRFFPQQEAFFNFNAKICYYWRIVNSWVLTVPLLSTYPKYRHVKPTA